MATVDEITQRYRTDLGRDPEAEGLNYWLNNDAGFRGSEFTTDVAAERDRNTKSSSFFDTLGDKYQTVLGRPMDAPGGNFWRNADATKASDAELNASWTEAANRELAARPKATPAPAAAPAMPQVTVQPIQATTPWDVQPNQTSAYQLEQILKSDSPLMQRARAQAMQTMNARGGLNSTMAGTAGEAAVIDAATPIARQDAGTYADAGRFNADSSNTFSRDSNAFSREGTMANFNLGANDWAAGQAATRASTAADQALAREQALAASNAGLGSTAADQALARQQALAASNAGLGSTTADQQLTRDQALALSNAGLKNTAADQQLARDQALAASNAALNKVATTTTNDQATQRGYINAISQARTDYAEKLAAISASSTMDSGLKAETLTNLRTTYNTMIGNYAKLLGWTPESWLIVDASNTPAATAASTSSVAAAAAAAASGAGGGGAGDAAANRY